MFLAAAVSMRPPRILETVNAAGFIHRSNEEILTLINVSRYTREKEYFWLYKSISGGEIVTQM
jgi:hypothetical protein